MVPDSGRPGGRTSTSGGAVGDHVVPEQRSAAPRLGRSRTTIDLRRERRHTDYALDRLLGRLQAERKLLAARTAATADAVAGRHRPGIR